MEFTIAVLEEMIKDTDMKCEMVTATHMKTSEHRRKVAKHIFIPTRSSQGYTIQMLLKNNKLKYPFYIGPVKGLPMA